MTTEQYNGSEQLGPKIKQLLGIIKHHGLEVISKHSLKEILSNGECTQEQIDNAQQKYLQDYFSN
jgi:hypothetical protein